MDFKEYQKSSAKHLATCQSILNAIDIFKANNDAVALIVQDSKIYAVLHNVYYLSGYTLESIINYSILKHFKWKQPSVYTLDHGFSSKCDLTFYPGVQRKSGHGKYQFWLSQHEFQRNIQILAKTFPSSGIPFVDKSVPVDPEVNKLYYNWSVETRYHPESTKYATLSLNKENITKFVGVTDIIYNGLMKIVG